MKLKKGFTLLLIGLLATAVFIGLVKVPSVSASFTVGDSTSITADLSDGVLYAVNSDWDGVHDASTGNLIHISATTTGYRFGCVDDVANQLSRTFMWFDTSSLADDLVITYAEVWVTVLNTVLVPVNMSVQKGTQHDTMIGDDYDAFSGSEYCHMSIPDMYGSNVITLKFKLNAQGIADVNKTGKTYYCFREYDHDYLDAGWAVDYGSNIYLADAGATYAPKLVVYYGTGAKEDSLIARVSSLADNVNWTDSIEVMYAGLSLNKTTLTQIQAAIDLKSTNETYTGLGMMYPWMPVIYWYYVLQKFDVFNETTVKWALNEATMMANGLPDTNGDPSFWVYHRYVLWGYYWSDTLNYLESKWNLTTAYTNFKSAIDTLGFPALYIYANNTAKSYETDIGEPLVRTYDEGCQTTDMFVDFWLLGIPEAFPEAIKYWNWINQWEWIESTQHYVYRVNMATNATSGEWFECGQPNSEMVMWKLYYYDQVLGNITRLITDCYTRHLADMWGSPMWGSPTLGTAYAVIHCNPTNNQLRLKDTVNAWHIILGIYDNSTDEDYKARVQMMLNGTSATPMEAWELLFNPTANLYDSATNKFRLFSDVAVSNEATAYVSAFSLNLGITPVNGTLAMPVDEVRYQRPEILLDSGLYNCSLADRMVTIPVLMGGYFHFMLGGTPFDYELATTGLWALTFSEDWNSITSADRIGDLPDNRHYIGETGEAPIPVSVVASPEINADFEIDSIAQQTPYSDDFLIDTYQFEVITTEDFIQWKIENSSGTFYDVATTINLFIYADTDLTLMYEGEPIDNISPTYSNLAHNSTLAGNVTKFSGYFNDNVALHYHIFSTNNTGPWVNDTAVAFSATPSWGNVTKTLNSTVGLVIGYQWFLNDTSDNWNTTSIQTLTTTDPPPEFLTVIVSQTYAGNETMFSCKWVDESGLSGFIFGTNNTGAWANDTWASFATNPDWANATKTLTSTVGATVQYEWWANDTSGNWANTGILILTTTTYAPPPYVPPIITAGSNATLYMRSDTFQTNNVTGYGLHTENTAFYTVISANGAGDVNVSFGFRVWIVNSRYVETELTDGTPIGLVNRTTDGQGFQTGTWTCPSHTLTTNFEALKVTVYIKFGAGDWQLLATFISETLVENAIKPSTWAFCIYTSRAYTTITAASFSFGSSTRNSAISGIDFSHPTPQEIALALGSAGDWVQMFLYPFMYLIGNLFYGCGLLFLCVLYYLRFKRWEPILIMVLLFGGGGLFGYLIPNIAYRLIYIVVLFVIATQFYRVFN